MVMRRDQTGGHKVEVSRYYSPAEVAEMFSVSKRSILRWIADGKVKAMRTPGGRDLRILGAEILRHSGAEILAAQALDILTEADVRRQAMARLKELNHKTEG